MLKGSSDIVRNEMDLQEEIYIDIIYNAGPSAISIRSLEKKAEAFSFKNKKEYGVFFEIPEKMNVHESFSGIDLYSASFTLESREISSCLILSCSIAGQEEKFSHLCTNFVDSANRETIIKEPYLWWDDWKKLLGNINRNKKAYDILGEMITLNYMIVDNQEPSWEGEKAVVDIIGKTYDCEVKSTIIRNAYAAEISSRFQLDKRTNGLALMLCVFEKSPAGTSIEDMIAVLEKNGMNRIIIESKLNSIGLDKGRSARNEKYRLIEMRKYDVNDQFPIITNKSFKNDIIPIGVTSIRYTVDLSSVNYRTIDHRPR